MTILERFWPIARLRRELARANAACANALERARLAEELRSKAEEQAAQARAELIQTLRTFADWQAASRGQRQPFGTIAVPVPTAQAASMPDGSITARDMAAKESQQNLDRFMKEFEDKARV